MSALRVVFPEIHHKIDDAPSEYSRLREGGSEFWRIVQDQNVDWNKHASTTESATSGDHGSHQNGKHCGHIMSCLVSKYTVIGELVCRHGSKGCGGEVGIKSKEICFHSETSCNLMLFGRFTAWRTMQRPTNIRLQRMDPALIITALISCTLVVSILLHAVYGSVQPHHQNQNCIQLYCDANITLQPIKTMISPHRSGLEPIKTMTDFEALQTFTEIQGQSRYSWFIKDDTHKLLYCFIPKNACTVFKTLFYAMINDESPSMNRDIEIIHAEIDGHPGKYKPTPALTADILLNPDNGWSSFVVLRDPLERLVSGFMDKCVRDARHWCEGTRTLDFRVFLKRILLKMKQGRVMDIHDHYRPQYTFCGLGDHLDSFDHIIYFQKETIAEDTRKFMADVGVEKWYSRWGRYHNETMFTIKSPHSNPMGDARNSITDQARFYSKFYDSNSALEVIDAFHDDYQRLRLPHPHWVQYLK